MKITGIVFDKDGTLLDLAAFWWEPVRRAASAVLERLELPQTPELTAELLHAAGFSPAGAVLPEGLVVAGTNLDIAKAWGVILSRRGGAWNFALEMWSRNLLATGGRYGRVRGPAMLPELLTRLKKQGLLLGIATSDDYEQTDYCLEQMKIRTFFHAVMTADRVRRPKPAPDMMEAICLAWNVPAGQILMVGDSKNDMRFAEKSGAVGVYLRQDAVPLPKGAAFQISDLWELPPLLEGMAQSF